MEGPPLYLYLSTYGREDPIRATLVFAAAIAARALAPAPRVAVALLGNGVEFISKEMAQETRVAGARSKWKTIEDMIQAARTAGVEVHCWVPCYEAPVGCTAFNSNNVKERKFVDMTPADFAKLTAVATRVISF